MKKEISLSRDISFLVVNGYCYIPYYSFCFISGETLPDERINGGAFVGADGVQFPHKLIPVSYTIVWGLFFSVLTFYSFYYIVSPFKKLFIISVLFSFG